MSRTNHRSFFLSLFSAIPSFLLIPVCLVCLPTCDRCSHWFTLTHNVVRGLSRSPFYRLHVNETLYCKCQVAYLLLVNLGTDVPFERIVIHQGRCGGVSTVCCVCRSACVKREWIIQYQCVCLLRATVSLQCSTTWFGSVRMFHLHSPVPGFLLKNLNASQTIDFNNDNKHVVAGHRIRIKKHCISRWFVSSGFCHGHLLWCLLLTNKFFGSPKGSQNNVILSHKIHDFKWLNLRTYSSCVLIVFLRWVNNYSGCVFWGA